MYHMCKENKNKISKIMYIFSTAILQDTLINLVIQYITQPVTSCNTCIESLLIDNGREIQVWLMTY